MKKSLLAVAAIGAFASAAQAQSSVTVYGLLDYGYAGSSQTSAGTAGTAAGTTQTYSVLKTQNSGIMGNGESTSRLGFRGNEDLGGGKSAFFTAEVALNTDPTASPQAGLFSTSATGNRQIFVGAASKGLGKASLGLQYTPIHNAVGQTNAGGTNNQMGDVIYDRSGSGSAFVTSGMSTNDSYTVRTSNALILNSENIAGFTLNGMVVSRGTTTTQVSSTSGGQATNSGYGVGVNYNWQKLLVTANYQTFKQETAASTALTVGYNGGNWTTGTNAADTQQYYAATYDFGILKAFAGYVNRKVVNVDINTNYVARTAQQIGVRAPITPTIQTWASVGSGRINNTGTNGPTAKFYGWQVGTDYSLSKRTNLYAIYGASNTSNVTTGAYAATATGMANSSYNQSSYAVGVRHTF